MVPAPLRRYGTWSLVTLGILLGLLSLLLLSRSVENSEQFGYWQPWILVFNFSGLVLLTIVLARKIQSGNQPGPGWRVQVVRVPCRITIRCSSKKSRRAASPWESLLRK